MKFIQIYLLTFVIVLGRRVANAGEFSKEDLKFIAGELYPDECFQLLTHFSGAKGALKSSPRENNRLQCLESLMECNEKGKKGGCTKMWMEESLRKLGRSDLASRLRKRWKKKPKSKRKNSNRKLRLLRKGRSKDGKNHGIPRKRIVKSHRRDTIKNRDWESEDDFYRRFVIFLVAGTLAVIIILGSIVIVSYRRACRCYKNYLKSYDNKAQERSLDRGFSSNGSRRPTNSQVQYFLQNKEEYTKLFEQPNKIKNEGPLWSEAASENTRIIKSLDTAVQTYEKGCKCTYLKKNYRRNASPCARIKRFFECSKGHSQEVEDSGKSSGSKVPDGEKRRNQENNVKKTKRNKKKSRKSASSRGKCRERRVKKMQRNSKDVEGEKTENCTCEMCKLFNVTEETKFVENAKMIRQRTS